MHFSVTKRKLRKSDPLIAFARFLVIGIEQELNKGLMHLESHEFCNSKTHASSPQSVMHQQVRSDIRLKTWCIFMFSHDSSLVRSPSFEELILSSSKDFLVSGGEPGPLHITESAFIEHCCKQVNAGMAGFQNSLELQGEILGASTCKRAPISATGSFLGPASSVPSTFRLRSAAVRVQASQCRRRRAAS